MSSKIISACRGSFMRNILASGICSAGIYFILIQYADLFLFYDKFSSLHAMDERGKGKFFAVEYWVNNGVP